MPANPHSKQTHLVLAGELSAGEDTRALGLGAEDAHPPGVKRVYAGCQREREQVLHVLVRGFLLRLGVFGMGLRHYDLNQESKQGGEALFILGSAFTHFFVLLTFEDLLNE